MWGILVVLLAVLLAVAGQAVVQWLLPLPLRNSNNAAIGAIYQAIAVVYGVTLAFALFLVWNEIYEVQRTTEHEAGNLGDLYRLAGQFPEPEREQIRELARSYTRVVIEEEWPLMGQGRASQASPRAQALAEELTESVEGFEPGTTGQQGLHTEGLRVVGELQDDRELRLLESRRGVPPLLWGILVIGGVLMIAFTSLFGMKSPWVHRLSIAGLTAIIVFASYTVYRTEYPFTGDVRVEPDAFELVLRQMGGDNEP